MEIDDTVAHTGEKSVKVIGISATGVPWHTKVICLDHIPVEEGKPFTAAFWAKVDENEGQAREVELSVQMRNEPWPGSYNRAIVLDSTDWKEYTDTFIAKADEAGTMMIGLSVAQSTVSFWIDDFRVFEGDPADEIGAVRSALSPRGKLVAPWGAIKSRR